MTFSIQKVNVGCCNSSPSALLSPPLHTSPGSASGMHPSFTTTELLMLSELKVGHGEDYYKRKIIPLFTTMPYSCHHCLAVCTFVNNSFQE